MTTPIITDAPRSISLSRTWSPSRENVWLGGVALAKLVLHLATSATFPRELNEYYFLELSKRLDWGFVDVAPLGPLLFRLSSVVFGESLFGTRILPAVAGAITVYVTGLLARRLGGGVFAQTLAATAFLFAPWFLRAQNAMVLNAYEPLFWVTAIYLLVRIFEERRSHLFVPLGAVLGLGILLKPTILLLVFGIGVGLLVSGRKYLGKKELWIGAAIAVLLATPFVVWMGVHHWVSFEFGTSRRLPMSFLMSLVTLAMWLLPATLPLWAAGLVALLRNPSFAHLRPLGWACVSAFVALQFGHGKNYYVLSICPILLAAGAVAAEKWARWARVAQYGLLVTVGLFWLPLGIPFLSIPAFDRYCQFAYPRPSQEGMYSPRVLYLGRFGWEETATKVARIYHALPAEEQAGAVVLARRYWAAGPLNFYGPDLGLPRVISGDVQYWLWGPGEASGDVALLVGFDEEEARALYSDLTTIVEPLETSPEGESLTVRIGRRPLKPLAAKWSDLKSFGPVVLPNGDVPPMR